MASHRVLPFGASDAMPSVSERGDDYYSLERDVEPVTVQLMPMQLNEPLKVPAPAFTVMSRLVIVRLSIGTSALVGTISSAVMR